MTPEQKFRREIFRELRHIDPDWNPGTESFRAGMVMLAMIGVGLDVEALARVTVFPKSFVELVIRRARKSGMIRGKRLRVEWFEQEHGGFSALLDALVVGGHITRTPSPKTKEKTAAVRAQRIARGVCTNCGGARDGEQVTCSKCRASMKASVAKRQEPWDGGVIAARPKAERYYQHNDHAPKRRSTAIGDK